jgi:hypothetical protein
MSLKHIEFHFFPSGFYACNKFIITYNFLILAQLPIKKKDVNKIFVILGFYEIYPLFLRKIFNCPPTIFIIEKGTLVLRLIEPIQINLVWYLFNRRIEILRTSGHWQSWEILCSSEITCWHEAPLEEIPLSWINMPFFNSFWLRSFSWWQV